MAGAAGGELREVLPALLRAQSSAFTKQAPPLYSILCVDAATLCYTHIGKAPLQLDPNQFVTLAERLDIIYWLTRTLLRKTLAAAAQWPPKCGCCSTTPAWI
jgi:predicted signal transduction protein with EAL and GGDEF domain